MIAIVCHDAGGAELLSSWVRSCSTSCCFVLDGPAVSIFKRKLGDTQLTALEEAVERCDWVLCGTSWQSDLERKAIALSIRAGKYVVAFLDHWTNYRERFLERGVAVMPNEIWVGDEYAAKIAREVFPAIPLVLKSNPYFEDVLRELNVIRSQRKVSEQPTVLYVCEPIREHALVQHGDERYWGYTEEEALRFFLDNLCALDYKLLAITLRPHPSESHSKYKWAEGYASSRVRLGGGKSLLEEIVATDIVVGCESMAMVIGLLANKRVVSSIPPGGRECSLPQKEIESLQELVAAKKRASNA